MTTVVSRTFIVSLLLLVSLGCGYRTLGSGKEAMGMPGGVRTLSIPFFTNLTGRPDVETVITSALVSEFMNTVEIVPPGKGEAVMEGVIKKYRVRPVSFTQNDIVNEYRLTVVFSVRIVRTSDGELLWEDKHVKDYEDFVVNPDNVISTKDAERSALEKIARDRARLLKERILENL